MRLLVGSVFIDDSPQQVKWLDLQLNFLKHSTENFEHIAFVSNGSPNNSFFGKTHVATTSDTSLMFSDAHLNGLRSLLELFREWQDEFDCFLFLDSDAFPIKKNWLPQLVNKMRGESLFDDRGNFMLKKQDPYEIAVVLRSENLETRLHASVLFAKKEALQHIDFDYRQIGFDLLGHQEKDICLPEYQFRRKNKAFPLIRSNKVNVHPLACGVYYDSFYHHAAGSRNNLLVRGNHYWDRYYKIHIDHRFTEALMSDPCEFVQSLAGWNPDKYARF